MNKKRAMPESSVQAASATTNKSTMSSAGAKRKPSAGLAINQGTLNFAIAKKNK